MTPLCAKLHDCMIHRYFKLILGSILKSSNFMIDFYLEKFSHARRNRFSSNWNLFKVICTHESKEYEIEDNSATYIKKV